MSAAGGEPERRPATTGGGARPSLIFPDKPVCALDRDRDFLALLFGEARTADASILMVSHDESLGRQFDRVGRLSDIAVVSREGQAA